MADSDITVTGLVANGGVAQVSLQWDEPNDPHTPGGLPLLQHAVMEAWAGSVDDRDAPTTEKIGETTGNVFTHSGLSRSESFYYWIRSRNRAGLYSEWFPSSAVGGVQGTELNNDTLLATPGFWKTPNGLIFQWGLSTISGELGTVVTFPVSFPTVVQMVHVGPRLSFPPVDATNGLVYAPLTWADSFLLTSFRCFAGLQAVSNIHTDVFFDEAIDVAWMAIGY